MRVDNALLLIAALFPTSSSAASLFKKSPQQGVPNPPFLSSNTTTTSSSPNPQLATPPSLPPLPPLPPGQTPEPPTRGPVVVPTAGPPSLIILSSSSSPSSDLPQISPPVLPTLEVLSSLPHSSIPSSSRFYNSSTIPRFSNTSTTPTTFQTLSTKTPYPTHHNLTRSHSPKLISGSSTTRCVGSKNETSACLTDESTVTRTIEWEPISTTPPRPNSTPRPCTPIIKGKTLTEYRIIYTSTVTFFGNRTDYVPPYKTIETPYYCPPTAPPALPPSEVSDGTIAETAAQVTDSSSMPSYTENAESRTGSIHHPKSGHTNSLVMQVPVVTVVTTDKNPAVVFPSDPPPNYSQTWDKHISPPGNHQTVGPQKPDGVAPPIPTYTITAGPTVVIINQQTFTAGPGQTTVVTVGNGVFTINPSAIIGGGESIRRPGLAAPAPTTGNLGGLAVSIMGSNVIVDGTTLVRPVVASTTYIHGQLVSIGPNGIAINGQTMAFARPTDVMIAGGEMITAAGTGIVVIHSTTFTYGSGIPEVIKVINDDVISIEPTGVIVHNLTIGGSKANPTETTYELVGAATIEKIPPSMVVINGKTYIIGPGMSSRTVSAGNEMITLGPVGLVMASMTMNYPFDSTIVTTISHTGANPPKKTGTGDDSSGLALRPDLHVGIMCICIAIGVLVF